MWTWNKLKKVLLVIGISVAIPLPAQACNPLNPICLFQKILKMTPGMPVFDFVSLPPMIPHIPAAITKEANQKLKQIQDEAMQKIRSTDSPSMSSLKVEPKMPEFEKTPEGQLPAPLEAFPNVDLDDPLEIAKAIEPLYVRPGWDSSEEMTLHDKALMSYYAGQNAYNNLKDVAGAVAELKGKIKDIASGLEDIQNKMNDAKDLADAKKVNLSAHVAELQIMAIENKLDALMEQVGTTQSLFSSTTVLNKPLLNNS